MAPLLTTIGFMCYFIISKRKKEVIFLVLSMVVYFIKTDAVIWTLIISYNFFINVILLYSLFVIDKTLEKSGFFKVFSIPEIAPFLSKGIILGTLFFIHLNLYFLITLGLQFKFIVLGASIFLFIIILKIIIPVIGNFYKAIWFLGFVVALTVTFYLFPESYMILVWFFLLLGYSIRLCYRRLKII